MGDNSVYVNNEQAEAFQRHRPELRVSQYLGRIRLWGDSFPQLDVGLNKHTKSPQELRALADRVARSELCQQVAIRIFEEARLQP